MKRFIEGVDGRQSTLFPERLDDFIASDNPTRVIEAFVEALDLRALGFCGVDPCARGRPAYHPAVLLKRYIYGYLNRIHSNRRLEREAQRNIELMWLSGRLAPDFKTIGDFRRDNGKAICGVCREFVLLCRRLDLFSAAIVAIDGSKFKAVNNRDKNFTSAKMQRRMEQIEESIARYLDQLDRADREEPAMAEAKTAHLKEKIEALQKEARRLQAPDRQISLSDPDARSMATSGRGTGMVGYNVQTAVDTQHHLIVAQEVTNIDHDRLHLAKMAQQAQEAMGTEQLTVGADRGYFDSDEILACHDARVRAYLPKPRTSASRSRGRFERSDFRYDAAEDVYRCPAAERLTWRFRNVESGRTLDSYWSSACPRCAIKAQCTPSPQRRIKRWVHETVLEALPQRLDREPEMMRLRRQTAEHPFGTIKAWMGHTHFLTKTLPRVSTEMSLHVLAYNLKRLMNLIGVPAVLQAVGA